MAGRYLIIDAHNVIFAIPELLSLHRRSPAAARTELLNRMLRHQDASGFRVVVVFDGGTAAGPQTEISGPAGVQVFYANAGLQADTIIERLAAKYAGQHEIRIASNDAMVRQTALSFGATCLSVATLQEEMASAEADLQQALRRHRATGRTRP